MERRKKKYTCKIKYHKSDNNNRENAWQGETKNRYQR